MSGTANPVGRSHHVVIAGGGVAALEALLGLRELAGPGVKVTLVSPDREFLYRPVTVGEPFGRSEARAYPLSNLIATCPGDEFLWSAVSRVDVGSQHVMTDMGERISYDSLVLAIGAQQSEPLPGALTFRGRPDVGAVRDLISEMISGSVRSVAFALASERSWSLPIYELALMTAAELRRHGPSAGRVWVVTPEDEPLAWFGPAAARAIQPILDANGILVRTMCRPAAIDGRALRLAGGGEIYVDRVVTLPAPAGLRIPGVPGDGDGFIPVDSHGCVAGCDSVYAAGDATSFPLKQGGLAAQQADAVAETIAARAGAAIVPQPFRPVLRGFLMTGGAPLYLRAEPQRLPREVSVAIEATPLHHSSHDASAAAGQALWWPPTKVAGRYLSGYLASAHAPPVGTDQLVDRVPVLGRPLPDAEYQDALELSLLLADCDARWGDYRSALSALDAAEALQGSLPPEYEAKRRDWAVAHP